MAVIQNPKDGQKLLRRLREPCNLSPSRSVEADGSMISLRLLWRRTAPLKPIGAAAGLWIGCLIATAAEADSPLPIADKLAVPARGFFMGVLPMPAAGQPFDEAYREAARYAELAPVWGRPSPFFALAADLRGDWG